MIEILPFEDSSESHIDVEHKTEVSTCILKREIQTIELYELLDLDEDSEIKSSTYAGNNYQRHINDGFWEDTNEDFFGY